MEDEIVDDGPATVPQEARSIATERPPPNANASSSRAVQQPKPQNLGARASASVILVSPRQKGNPALGHIKSVGWEYSDIPADFVLGATTCALFLSLKYHRLHPEYIYTRIKSLGGRYGLRIVLVLVDIENHEDPLKELSKTSLINNVTIILSWSSQEAGRYLELYKNYEHAAPTSIKGIQSTTYSDQLVDFVTVPRGINKTDAVSLVATFGSIRTAINARPEEIELISGWGSKKVQRWCKTVREPFRTKKAKQRGLTRELSGATPAMSRGNNVGNASSAPSKTNPVAERQAATSPGIGAALPAPQAGHTAVGATSDADIRTETRAAEDFSTRVPGEEEEEAMAAIEAGMETSSKLISSASAGHGGSTKKRPADEELDDGVAAALSKLRKT